MSDAEADLVAQIANLTAQPTRQDGTRHARYARRRREKLAEYLEEVGPEGATIKVSRHPDCPHGQRDGYDLYGCRCAECAEHSAGPRIQEYREQRYQAATVAVLRDHGVPEGRASELAPELIEVWRRSRGPSRQRKLTLHLGRTFPGMTSAQVLAVSQALITALSAANTNRRADDLTATS